MYLIISFAKEWFIMFVSTCIGCAYQYEFSISDGGFKINFLAEGS